MMNSTSGGGGTGDLERMTRDDHTGFWDCADYRCGGGADFGRPGSAGRMGKLMNQFWSVITLGCGMWGVIGLLVILVLIALAVEAPEDDSLADRMERP